MPFLRRHHLYHHISQKLARRPHFDKKQIDPASDLVL
jgi:hypothetical protein